MIVYATTHLINVAFNCVELKFPFPPSHVRSECVADISRVMLDLRVLRAFPHTEQSREILVDSGSVEAQLEFSAARPLSHAIVDSPKFKGTFVQEIPVQCPLCEPTKNHDTNGACQKT